MQTLKKLCFLLFLTTIIIFIQGCENRILENQEQICNKENGSINYDDIISTYFINSGFSKFDIRITSDKVILSDDIVFSKKDLIIKIKENNSSSKGYYFNCYGIPAKESLQDIKYSFAWNVPSDWKTAMRSAFQSASCIRFFSFREVLFGADVIITYKNLNSSTIQAAAYYPEDYKVGQEIMINSNTTWTLNSSEKMRIGLHEIGHILGLTHPGDGFWISGTEINKPGNLYKTVMRSDLHPYTKYTYDDLKTFEYIYGPIFDALNF